MNKKYWSNNDINILIKNFSIKTNEELQELFPNRTFNSINNKAKKLKLKRNTNIIFENRRNAHLGSKNSMWGKKIKRNPLTDEQKKNLSEIRKKLYADGKVNTCGINNGMFGKPSPKKGIKLDVEIKNKMSEIKKNFWKNLTEEESNKRKNKLRNEWLKKIFTYNISDSKPEKIFENYLINNKHKYKKKINIGYYNCDFIINDLYIIEIQGDYWHANPKIYDKSKLDKIQQKNINRDKNKLKYLQNLKYCVLYLWEYDIINNFNQCENQLNEFLYG